MEMQSSTRLATRPAMTQDSYTAGIELSNTCREFYRCRVKSAEGIKKRLGMGEENQPRCQNPDNNRRPKSSLDNAMERLRKEMSLLMDQDLSLMKQLLTLNESIEELKWQRRYVITDSDSLPLSSCDLEDYSDTDMFDSESDLAEKYLDFPNRSTLLSDSVTNVDDIIDEFARLTSASSTLKKTVDSPVKSRANCGKPLSATEAVVLGKGVTVCHSEQDSFDSGIHSDEERPILV